MAEFCDIMRQWRRMCKAYTTDDDDCCKGCLILDLNNTEAGCDAIFSDWAQNTDWKEVEDIITAWAEENPEPVYPTWEEWLAEQGIFYRGTHYGAFDVTKLHSPIPAGIAQKLGIKPKEDVKLTGM